MQHSAASIGSISVGAGAPLVLIAGQNVIESESEALACAERIAPLVERYGLPWVFKASFDKANRSSLSSYRGLGLDEGLRILQRVKQDFAVPVLTDVHEPVQAKVVAEVADCLQVPAFLCRQTDLVAACAATGKAVNIKKGQFIAPEDMQLAVEKVRRYGEGGAILTERGVCFGYHQLVVDMRGIVRMREFAPVCLDATHSVQEPGGAGIASSGESRFVAPLAKAAVAVGIDALFVETHESPEEAPCDGASQIRIQELDRLLAEVCAIDAALRGLQP